MASVVIVTTAELDDQLLGELVQPGDDVHVVVPAVEQSRLQWLTNAEDAPRDHAAQIAEQVAEDVPSARTTAQENRDPPSQAVTDAIREYRPDRVVLLLRAEDESTWLERGEIERVPTEIDGVPVERRILD